MLLVILITLAGGAGTLWWAADHRTVPARRRPPGGTTSRPANAGRWQPTPVAPCSRVKLTTTRQGQNGTLPAHPGPRRSAAPGRGATRRFPKSNADGPFPGESCDADGDKDYSPVGDHVVCVEKTWQVIA